MYKSVVVSERYNPTSPFIFQNDSFDRLIPKAAEIGFDAVELQIADPKKIDIVQLKAVCDEHKIFVSSLATGLACSEGLCLTAKDAAIREKTVERLKEHLDLMELLGNHIKLQIGMLCGGISGVSDSEIYYRILCESLKEICEYAEKKNTEICIEPINLLDMDGFHTWEIASDIIKTVDSCRLKISMDLYHMRFGERDMVESILKYGNIIGSIQISDDNRKAPGLGNFRFANIIKAIQQIGYDDAIIFECLPLPDEMTAAAICVNFFDSVLRRRYDE